MGRLDEERQNELEPKRMEYAIEQLTKLGYTPTYVDKTRIEFGYMDAKVTLFPYSGWHTGKTIKDGRGLKKLLEQLKTNQP